MYAQETSIYKYILIAGCLLGCLLILFIVTILRQHRRNHALYISNIESGIESLENERKSIAADMHDELGPLLSAIKMQLECMDHLTKEDLRYKERSISYIDTIIEKMRGIANGLLPSILINEGLLNGITEYISIIKAETKLHIELIINLERATDPKTDIHVYRIIQEIIHNTIKHSEATILKISIDIDNNDTITIRTKDNGIGINKFDRMNKTGLGMSNIMRRVNILGGKIHINTALNKGMAFHIAIPLK